MIAAAQYDMSKKQTRYFGPAQVIALNLPKRTVCIQINGFNPNVKIHAKLAIIDAKLCQPGNSVLISGDSMAELYVIGILSLPTANSSSNEKLVLNNGVTASVAKTSKTEQIELRTDEGELIFQYDATTKKSRVNIASGDLEFISEKGSIVFSSAQNIRFFSQQSINMTSLNGIQMMTSDLYGKMRSSIELTTHKLGLKSSFFSITALRGNVDISETTFTGQTMVSTINHVKLTAKKLTTLAQDVVAKAKSYHQIVDGLCQFKAGRMRTLIDNSYHLKAKKAFMKADSDLKVNAKKINIG
ncbi:MAG: hypothetical protein ACI84K_001535 [Pseudohongiellaceae bacterium]|jgi:hypothetical protein